MSARIGMTAHEYREELEERCNVLSHQKEELIHTLQAVLYFIEPDSILDQKTDIKLYTARLDAIADAHSVLERLAP